MADTPSGSKSQISSSLMERLKRCGRYHKSPIAPKQLRNDLASQSFVTPDKILFIEQLHTDSIDLSTSKLDSNNPIPMTNESENVKLNNANYPCISFEETAERIDVTSELSVSGENCVVKKVMVGTPSISFAKRTHDKISTDSPVSGACKQSRHLGLNRTPVNQNRKTFLPKFQQKLFETPDSAQKYADALPSTPNSSPSTPDSVHQTDTDASIEKVGLDGVADLMVDEKLGFAETGNPVISEFKRKPRADNCCSQISGTLRNRHATLTAVLATKTDVLRKLNLVKMYRSKNNLDELQGLIDKWRGVSQEAIQDLYSHVRDTKSTLQFFIASMQLCPKLLQFNAEEDSFD